MCQLNNVFLTGTGLSMTVAQGYKVNDCLSYRTHSIMSDTARTQPCRLSDLSDRTTTLSLVYPTYVQPTY